MNSRERSGSSLIDRLSPKSLGYLEGGMSAVINLILFGLKLWAGRSSGSVAMVADAWHTLSDTLTSLVVIFGFWISSRPRDHEHPFGHGRAEPIAGIVIGVLLGTVGFRFIRDSYLQLQSNHAASFDAVAITIFGVSAVIKEGIARFSIRAGKRTSSTSLIADGWHHRSDAIASVVIVAGALVGRRIWWIDGVLGFVVSILILYAAFDVIKEAAASLLGERPTDTILQHIRRLSDSAPHAFDVHHVHMHRYGSHVELTLHTRMRGDVTLEEAHEASTMLEERIREEMGYEATVHMEPSDPTDAVPAGEE